MDYIPKVTPQELTSFHTLFTYTPTTTNIQTYETPTLFSLASQIKTTEKIDGREETRARCGGPTPPRHPPLRLSRSLPCTGASVGSVYVGTPPSMG